MRLSGRAQWLSRDELEGVFIGRCFGLGYRQLVR